MITDEERREVAAELRHQAAYGGGSLAEWWSRLQETVTGEVDFPDPQETFQAIADLIDSFTCTDISDFDHEAFKCSRCGYRVLSRGSDISDAVVISDTGLVSEYRYCPACGAEVVVPNEP